MTAMQNTAATKRKIVYVEEAEIANAILFPGGTPPQDTELAVAPAVRAPKKNEFVRYAELNDLAKRWETTKLPCLGRRPTQHDIYLQLLMKRQLESAHPVDRDGVKSWRATDKTVHSGLWEAAEMYLSFVQRLADAICVAHGHTGGRAFSTDPALASAECDQVLSHTGQVDGGYALLGKAIRFGCSDQAQQLIRQRLSEFNEANGTSRTAYLPWGDPVLPPETVGGDPRLNKSNIIIEMLFLSTRFESVHCAATNKSVNPVVVALGVGPYKVNAVQEFSEKLHALPWAQVGDCGGDDRFHVLKVGKTSAHGSRNWENEDKNCALYAHNIVNDVRRLEEFVEHHLPAGRTLFHVFDEADQLAKSRQQCTSNGTAIALLQRFMGNAVLRKHGHDRRWVANSDGTGIDLAEPPLGYMVPVVVSATLLPTARCDPLMGTTTWERPVAAMIRKIGAQGPVVPQRGLVPNLTLADGGCAQYIGFDNLVASADYAGATPEKRIETLKPIAEAARGVYYKHKIAYVENKEQQQEDARHEKAVRDPNNAMKLDELNILHEQRNRALADLVTGFRAKKLAAEAEPVNDAECANPYLSERLCKYGEDPVDLAKIKRFCQVYIEQSGSLIPTGHDDFENEFIKPMCAIFVTTEAVAGNIGHLAYAHLFIDLCNEKNVPGAVIIAASTIDGKKINSTGMDEWTYADPGADYKGGYTLLRNYCDESGIYRTVPIHGSHESAQECIRVLHEGSTRPIKRRKGEDGGAAGVLREEPFSPQELRSLRIGTVGMLSLSAGITIACDNQSIGDCNILYMFQYLVLAVNPTKQMNAILQLMGRVFNLLRRFRIANVEQFMIHVLAQEHVMETQQVYLNAEKLYLEYLTRQRSPGIGLFEILASVNKYMLSDHRYAPYFQDMTLGLAHHSVNDLFELNPERFGEDCTRLLANETRIGPVVPKPLPAAPKASAPRGGGSGAVEPDANGLYYFDSTKHFSEEYARRLAVLPKPNGEPYPPETINKYATVLNALLTTDPHAPAKCVQFPDELPSCPNDYTWHGSGGTMAARVDPGNDKGQTLSAFRLIRKVFKLDEGGVLGRPCPDIFRIRRATAVAANAQNASLAEADSV